MDYLRDPAANDAVIRQHVDDLRDPATHNAALETVFASGVLRATLVFSAIICSMAQVLAHQHERMSGAAEAMHARLEVLLQNNLSSTAASVAQPTGGGRAGAEVVDEVGSHVSESDVESFEYFPFPVIAPESDGFGDQLECYEVFDAEVAPPVLPAQVLPPLDPAPSAADDVDNVGYYHTI